MVVEAPRGRGIPSHVTSPGALGVVRNLPAHGAAAALDPAVVSAHPGLDLQQDSQHQWIGLGGELTLPPRDGSSLRPADHQRAQRADRRRERGDGCPAPALESSACRGEARLRSCLHRRGLGLRRSRRLPRPAGHAEREVPLVVGCRRGDLNPHDP
jgi:hypothetical protein